MMHSATIAAVRRAAVVAAVTLAFAAAMSVVVDRHYQTHLPHFDSIGSYTLSWQIANRLADPERGLWGTVRTTMPPTTWLIPLWGLLTAWAPRSPVVPTLLNVACLLIAQGCILAWARVHGLSDRRSVVLAFLPLAPGMLTNWDGGVQDLRRDPQLALLAVALVFLSLAYVRRPTVASGLALGLVVGLGQWSRDNAAALLLLAALPAVAVAAARARHEGVGRLLGLAWWPLLVAAPMVGAYYWINYDLILDRYTTTVWGVGEDRLGSLLAWWASPWHVLMGADPRYGGGAPVNGLLTLGLLGGLGAVLGTLVKVGWVEWRRDRASLILLASGVWLIVAVVLYSTLLLGYGPQWNAAPFLPIAAGWAVALAGLLGLVRRRGPAHRGNLLAATIAAAIVVVALLRMELGQPDAQGAAEVAAVRQLALALSDAAGPGGAGPGGAVAVLSIDLSKHHLAYYLAQAGRPPLTDATFRVLARDEAAFLRIDLERLARPGEDGAETARLLDAALRQHATAVLVATQPGYYSLPADTRPADRFWFRLWGQGMVDGLRADWQERGRFTVGGQEYAVLVRS